MTHTWKRRIVQFATMCVALIVGLAVPTLREPVAHAAWSEEDAERQADAAPDTAGARIIRAHHHMNDTVGMEAMASMPVAAPEDCSRYGGAKRVYLEAQAWWMPTPGKSGGTDQGHLHQGTCFPWAQQIKGTIPFDIRLMLHNNPGKLESLTMQIFGDKGSAVAAKKSFSPPLTIANCAQSGGILSTDAMGMKNCLWIVHLEADTTVAPYDGRQEFRIRPKISEPDGNTMVGSTSWQAYLTNGKPQNDYRSYDLMQGKGWYSGASYSIARIDGGFPTGPVKGTLSLKARCESDGPPVGHCLAAIDPDFHAGNPGTTILDQHGAWQGTIAIDTTKLSNGTHRLFLKTDTDDKRGSSNGGVQVFYFTVAN